MSSLFQKTSFFFGGYAALGMEPWALCALGKHPTSELCPALKVLASAVVIWWGWGWGWKAGLVCKSEK